MVLHTDDYYDILGVTALYADLNAIRAAYKAAALKYHPDKTNGDTAATAIFLKIQRAHEVLTDPDQRRLYDRDYYPNISKKKATAGQSQKDKPPNSHSKPSEEPPRPPQQEPPKPSQKMPSDKSERSQHQRENDTPDMTKMFDMYAGNRAAMLVLETYVVWLQISHSLKSLKEEATQEEQKACDQMCKSLNDHNKTLLWTEDGLKLLKRIQSINRVVSGLTLDCLRVEAFTSWPFYPTHEVLSRVTDRHVNEQERKLANVRSCQSFVDKWRNNLKICLEEESRKEHGQQKTSNSYHGYGQENAYSSYPGYRQQQNDQGPGQSWW